MNIYSLFEEVYGYKELGRNISNKSSILDDANIEAVENLIKVELTPFSDITTLFDKNSGELIAIRNCHLSDLITFYVDYNGKLNYNYGRLYPGSYNNPLVKAIIKEAKFKAYLDFGGYDLDYVVDKIKYDINYGLDNFSKRIKIWIESDLDDCKYESVQNDYKLIDFEETIIADQLINSKKFIDFINCINKDN